MSDIKEAIERMKIEMDDNNSFPDFDDIKLLINAVNDDGWVSVEDTVEPDKGTYLCLVLAKGAHTPYQRVLQHSRYEYSFGDWVEDDPDVPEGETYDEDECMFIGTGWHDEVDGHGGEYDYYIEVFRKGGSYGEVIKYRPLPKEAT